ncbi:MAG: hypothetical protein JNK02_07555 [Planctomycetes bacterium]|nr:hypothetical protein [Planctomycetota bacterium]
MKLSTSLALVLLASAAGAQSKLAEPVKDRNAGGYFPPPGGTSFLVAGGSDNCANASTADAISGLGTFAVTNVGATNGLPDAAGCVNTQLDVWFYWTSTVTGSVIVEACGGVTADTVLTVWNDGAPAGTCPTTSVGCNDDTCGLQSRVTFSAVSGQSYFFQWGAFGASTTYSGTFTVSTPPPPPANDDCATPIAISGPGVYPFDNRVATTGTQGQTEPLCLAFSSTAIHKDSWWTYTPTVSGTVEVSTCGQVLGGTDTRIAVYDGAGCPVAAAIACNDDNAACAAQTLSSLVSFTAVCGQSYTIQIGNFSAAASLYGTFTVTETGTACGPASTPYCFGDGTGTACPCGNSGAAGNGCASSVNANGANLTSSGNPSISADTLVLLGSGMPNSSALYFQGTSQISVVFGDGLRCAGGTVIRLGTKNNVAGASQYPDVGDVSVSVRGLNAAGDVRNYQIWYRNAAAFCTPSTFNLSNGLNLTWTP